MFGVGTSQLCKFVQSGKPEITRFSDTKLHDSVGVGDLPFFFPPPWFSSYAQAVNVGVLFFQTIYNRCHILFCFLADYRPRYWSPQRSIHALQNRADIAGCANLMPNRAVAGKYACTVCGKLFNQAGNRTRHQKMCHRADPVLCRCHVCGQAFNRADNLKIHIREKHGIGEQLVCSKCWKRFRSKVSLTTHMYVCQR